MSAYRFDLGTHARETSTASPEAQTWFDRGLVWSYAFNHEEAERCFAAAVETDPAFALAHWGIAYAAGPNYNKAWDAFDAVDLRASAKLAFDASERAVALADGASAVERALAEALRVRFPAPEPVEDFGPSTVAYADAMQAVYEAHPDDLDVAALYADALMNLTAWQLWDLRTGEPAAGARTLEARAVLERGLAAPGGMSTRGCCTCTSTCWRCPPARRTGSRPRTRCAGSSRTPGTCCTCRRTSTSSAATTTA